LVAADLVVVVQVPSPLLVAVAVLEDLGLAYLEN
jgi:hypothetical protein